MTNLPEGVTRRQVGKLWYICQDTGTSDFRGARENRQHIADGYCLQYWKEMEESRDRTRKSQKLSSDVPVGMLPKVGREPR